MGGGGGRRGHNDCQGLKLQKENKQRTGAMIHEKSRFGIKRLLGVSLEIDLYVLSHQCRHLRLRHRTDLRFHQFAAFKDH